MRGSGSTISRRGTGERFRMMGSRSTRGCTRKAFLMGLGFFRIVMGRSIQGILRIDGLKGMGMK